MLRESQLQACGSLSVHRLIVLFKSFLQSVSFKIGMRLRRHNDSYTDLAVWWCTVAKGAAGKICYPGRSCQGHCLTCDTRGSLQCGSTVPAFITEIRQRGEEQITFLIKACIISVPVQQPAWPNAFCVQVGSLKCNNFLDNLCKLQASCNGL